jgi:colanic acid biosynthesis glycosyl transferase WcaI
VKICLFTQYFHPDASGSSPTFISELVLQMVRTDPDLRIDVITSRSLYRELVQLPVREVWEGIKISRIGLPTGQSSGMVLRLLAGVAFTLVGLFRLLVRPRYDLIFVTTNPPPSPFAAWVLKRLWGTPYVYLIWDLYPDVPVQLGMLDPKGIVYRLAKCLQRSWLRAAEQVIVIGRCIQENIGRNYDIPLENMPVISHWADPSSFPQDKPSSFASRNGLEGFTVMYAGNIGLAQDLDIILDAALLLKVLDPEVRFLVVGNGPGCESVDRRIVREGIQNVRRLPAVPRADYPDLLAAADLCLVSLAPYLEGLAVPSKFYGILAAGKPVLAILSETCEIARVLQEQDCGIQVSPRNAGALVDAIRELRADPERARRMGLNARKVLESEYTLQRIAARFKTVMLDSYRIARQ